MASKRNSFTILMNDIHHNYELQLKYLIFEKYFDYKALISLNHYWVTDNIKKKVSLNDRTNLFSVQKCEQNKEYEIANINQNNKFPKYNFEFYESEAIDDKNRAFTNAMTEYLKST